MKRYLKDEGEWFDEYLNSAALDESDLIGRVVILHSLEDDEAETLAIKDTEMLQIITHAPDGSVLDVADSLDTSSAFGLA
tara:strand:+ start:153 stop:392 length:240 start_codon:yes stop_codon:yes gene_type:complete